MGVLKHFAPWHLFRSEGIETFCALGHILVWGYRNILSPKFTKILNDITYFSIIFYTKHFETF